MPNDRIAVRATYVHSRETTPEIVPLYAPVVAEKALSMLVHILVLTTQPNTSRCARFNAAKRKMKQPVNRAILSSFRLVFAIAISSCKRNCFYKELLGKNQPDTERAQTNAASKRKEAVRTRVMTDQTIR